MPRGSRKSRPNPPPSTAAAAPPRRPDASGGDDRADVLARWRRASASLVRGNHAKAAEVMEEAVRIHGGLSSSPPLLLHAYSCVHHLAADLFPDGKARAGYLGRAVAASRRAVELDPRSALLAHFHASLLLAETTALVNDPRELAAAFARVIVECERGVRITAPSDPELYNLGQSVPDGRKVLSNLCALHRRASDCKRRVEAELDKPKPDEADHMNLSRLKELADKIAMERSGAKKEALLIDEPALVPSMNAKTRRDEKTEGQEGDEGSAPEDQRMPSLQGLELE